jgi:hypothetical protein
MSVQPEARWPDTKHAILARPKYDTARWSGVPGWAGPVEKVVPGPLLKHVGWHGTTRHSQLGTTSAR